MYPRRQLEALARRREVLTAAIAAERWEIAEQAAVVVRPLAFLDRLYVRWKSVPPALRLALIPLLFRLQRRVLGRVPWIGTAVTWLPAVWKALPWLSSWVGRSSPRSGTNRRAASRTRARVTRLPDDAP